MKKLNLLAVCLLMLEMGCAVISNFDQNSYDSAQSLKNQSLDLISKAIEPVSKHLDEIAQLKSKLSAQLAYEVGKGQSNAVSAEQWKLLSDPQGHLLGGLLCSWESQTATESFSAPYLLEKQEQIGASFDEIIRLEGAKQKQ